MQKQELHDFRTGFDHLVSTRPSAVRNTLINSFIYLLCAIFMLVFVLLACMPEIMDSVLPVTLSATRLAFLSGLFAGLALCCFVLTLYIRKVNRRNFYILELEDFVAGVLE